MKIAPEERKLFGEILGENVTYYRDRKFKSQAQLAERARLSEKHIGKVERGIKIPGADTLSQIARALGVTTDALLEGTENIPPIKSFD